MPRLSRPARPSASLGCSRRVVRMSVDHQYDVTISGNWNAVLCAWHGTGAGPYPSGGLGPLLSAEVAPSFRVERLRFPAADNCMTTMAATNI